MTQGPSLGSLDARGADSLPRSAAFNDPVQRWFEASFPAPTRAQALGWPPIIAGESTLLLAPTGSGKTLAAFLTAIDRLMFTPAPAKKERCRVVYVSPLKALAVDVERNLRAPLAGIAAQGGALHLPRVSVRTRYSPDMERAQMARTPPDILITTPESLYLLLTSQAREILRSVETVIVDEIHSLVATKRGAHLFLSLERLQQQAGRELQRIGLSATQRPLEEVARLLGGGEPSGKKWRARPVTIVDAGSKKQLEVRVEVPVDDLSRLGELEELPSGPASAGPQRRSIWPSIHPRLLELIRAHRSTMIFVNSRRLAERLAGALNDLAGSEVALAHHGSVARDKRQEMEDRLKRGALPAIVATSSLEGVLDMLSGRYPSDEFAELRPRLTWDRIAGTLRAREGAARVAIANAGTIPDRGLYGVFLETGEPGGGKQRRVGELDEEMVFESREGDVFVLGASSWRIEEITEDKVIVTPAPGEPGKMPFWHGDRPGRPLEFGMHVGRLSRELARAPKAKALARLQGDGLDERAAANLVQYLHDQADATGEVPSDETVIVERYLDEVGDWRVCVLTPFGARVHAPWSTAVVRRLEQDRGLEVETMWTDDGMVFRVPESDAPPEVELFFPRADEVEDLVVQALGTTSLFAARFRENAARALLLPRRHPGRRSPLWAQRKRARDLLQVASRYGSFPLLLETYRECLRDVFDLPALQDVLRRVADRRVRVVSVETRTPSPFAASLLFSYVANFIYDGDAPLAERRAQALSVDQAQLRELLGEAEMRELLDPDAIAQHELLARRLGRPAHGADGLHDLLLQLGDLSEVELRARFEGEPPLQQLFEERRAFPLNLAGEKRWVAAEDAARVRDALGVPPPPGLPRELLELVKDPLGDLVSR